jgi:hypothetical protein
MLKPSTTSQIPFSFSPHQKNSYLPFENHSSADSSGKQEIGDSTENETSSEESYTFNNNVSVVKLLDMSNAAEVIGKLEMDDLRTLHNLIADRINSLVKAKREADLSKFNPGNRVRFKTRESEIKTGTVIRVNQKTISIAVDGDDHAWWKVSPQVVERI